jgi:4-diphosphocytidyl-2C-methyl-D-erythritol kinase
MHHLSWRAYAKVNLCLSVGAPEPEGLRQGWHAIASWMQCIDLFDEVRIAESEAPGRVTVRWADDAPRPIDIDWPIEKDLAHRAWKALEAHTGRPLPVSIEVVKRIPVGGGLGGGSSDAAAVLLGVPRLFGIDLAEDDLLRLAMSLGSDCGFFADPVAGTQTPARAALITGFGDQIQRVESAASELLLIIPGYGCPTGPVYKMFDEVLKEQISKEALERARRGIVGGKERQTTPRGSLVEARWAKSLESGRLDADKIFNDLEVPAYRVEPRLGQLSTALARATRETPLVTGSGSCLFFPTTVGKMDKLHDRIMKLLESVRNEEFGAGAKVLRTRLI